MAQPAPDFQKLSKRCASLCWLGWVFDFYDLILIAFLITDIEPALHLTPQSATWLVGVGLGASGLGGILFGLLSDIYGRKKILIWTVLLYSVGTFLTGFTQTPLQFLLTRFVTGLGLGGEWAVGHALIAESVPAEKRARWSAFLQSGEPVGVALAAVMGMLVAPHIGWRAVFWLSASTGMLALFFRKGLSESPLWLKMPKPGISERLQQMKGFFSTYWILLLLALLLAIFKLGTYWTCYTWLPRFVKESFGVAIGKSALWILCGQLGQFIGMFVFGACADAWGRRWAFTLFSLLTASALFPLALCWSLLFHTYPFLFWALIILLGFGSGCTAGFGALLSELFPTSQRTLAMGTVYNTARGIQLFAPVVVGYAVLHGGLKAGLLIPACLAFLTAAWVWTLPDKTRTTLF